MPNNIYSCIRGSYSNFKFYSRAPGWIKLAPAYTSLYYSKCLLAAVTVHIMREIDRVVYDATLRICHLTAIQTPNAHVVNLGCQRIL